MQSQLATKSAEIFSREKPGVVVVKKFKNALHALRSTPLVVVVVDIPDKAVKSKLWIPILFYQSLKHVHR